jgi:hypothetical protein
MEHGGSCFLQAPFLLHWYLYLWLNEAKEGNNVFPIDLQKFVQGTMSGICLYNYIFDDNGGSSCDIFNYIMGCRNRDLKIFHVNRKYEEILAALKQYGPALVIVRQMHAYFDDDNKFKYEGVPRPTKRMPWLL